MKLERCANSEISDQFLNLTQSEKKMTEEALVLRHDDEGVTTLTMNRPQARNALSQGMLRALLDAFIEVSTDEAVRVVILQELALAFVRDTISKRSRLKVIHEITQNNFLQTVQN